MQLRGDADDVIGGRGGAAGLLVISRAIVARCDRGREIGGIEIAAAIRERDFVGRDISIGPRFKDGPIEDSIVRDLADNSVDRSAALETGAEFSSHVLFLGDHPSFGRLRTNPYA